MRVLICDDDQNITEQLEKYIVEFFRHGKLDVPVIQSYNSGESLLSDSESKDIVFLDVEMPGLDGIFVGRELKKQDSNTIIFIITSYVEYLDDAMRFHVFRYLSKPLDKQRLFRNLRDAVSIYMASTVKVAIETKEGVHTVLASKIIAVQAQGRKVTVHTVGEDYQSVQNMRYWTETLCENCFYQTHRSFIVNMEYVDDFDHTVISLCQNRLRAYLTRRKYREFKAVYLLYLESTRK